MASGEDSDDPVAQGPERTIGSLQLSVAQISVDDGASERLSATVLDQEGRAFSALPTGTQVSWTVEGVVTAANGITPIQGALVRLLPQSGAAVLGSARGGGTNPGERCGRLGCGEGSRCRR